MIHPRNSSTNRYPLFKEIFGHPESNTILDFGGSSGNLLYFSNGEIKEENYTCIDIVKDAVEKGTAEFPNAQFVHYNRYNWMYNHSGDLDFKFPRLNLQQDYIWSYSVFSHTDLEEFICTVKWFLTLDVKKIGISFLTFNEMLDWAYNKRSKEYGSALNIGEYKNNTEYNIIYYFDNDKVVFNKPKLDKKDSKYFLAFYNADFLLNTFISIAPLYNVTIHYPGDGYVPFLFMEKKIV